MRTILLDSLLLHTILLDNLFVHTMLLNSLFLHTILLDSLFSIDKTQLQESTSALTQQSVELIGSVIPKAQSDISCFDRLTYLLQDWSRNVEVLETCCDRLLHEYLVHVKDILSGFEMQNSHLLASGVSGSHRILLSPLMSTPALPDNTV